MLWLTLLFIFQLIFDKIKQQQHDDGFRYTPRLGTSSSHSSSEATPLLLPGDSADYKNKEDGKEETPGIEEEQEFSLLLRSLMDKIKVQQPSKPPFQSVDGNVPTSKVDDTRSATSAHDAAVQSALTDYIIQEERKQTILRRKAHFYNVRKVVITSFLGEIAIFTAGPF